MAKRVHIKIADRGWILEKCAHEIATRAGNVTYGIDPDASADLQYYVNYSGRSRRVSPTEVAFFTHSELNPDARRRYFDAAKDVEHCVCMSVRYAQELVDSGISPDKVTTIAPGVDLDEFRPKVRIGVVGRTYHTGRKGEALVASVMDVPGIEWRFTGSGWPGPSVQVSEGHMADFYNDLDYVLVPSLYEGGPMCILEGLACGVPIISSDVGWADEYPHIPFENGNAESLRHVLTSLVAERQALRATVADRTWDRWAEEHLKLFNRLVGGGFANGATAPSKAQQSDITLLTHGSESKNQGGPSVRVPRTAAALREIGIAASAANFPAEGGVIGKLAHLFNIWPPHSSVEAARTVSNAGKHLVFSPILLNLSEIDFWQRRMLELISGGVDDTLLQRLEYEYSERLTWSVRRNPQPGFASRVREIAELSDALIFLSRREQALFEELSGEHECTRLIHNPVDANRFGEGDPKLFRDYIGLEDFILCVGRIEPRKNQLFLVAAAKQLGLPIVLVGHSAVHGEYAEAVKIFGGDDVRLAGRIEPASDLLRSAYAACRVFALPSWAEGAPLAALEAAASGANMVLSNRSGEEEYFGTLARYADPSSIESLKAGLLAAWNDLEGAERSVAVRKKVQEENSWERYAEQTAALYREVLQQEPRGATAKSTVAAWAAPVPTHDSIFVELSTTFNAKTVTGINRVEAFVSRQLAQLLPERARFVIWNEPTNALMEVPREIVLDGRVNDFVQSGSAPPLSTLAVAGGQLLVLGSGWLQNSRYTEAMGTLAISHRLELNVFVHDLIPALRPHWFPENYTPVFVENLRTVLRRASRVLTNSENTAHDIREFAAANAIKCPSIYPLKLAGEIESQTGSEVDQLPFADAVFAHSKFVLSVGAIHKRKNYELLYDCWLKMKARLGGSCPQLVIVGGVGWNGADTARALKEDPQLAGLVHILKGVDDVELAWLYRNCLFTVYPSLYEGFGLPVAESLAAGKVALASNVSSVPEIAPELCELLDPTDREAWLTSIMHFTLSTASRAQREERIRQEYNPISWRETVDGLLHALEQPAALDPNRNLYSVGEMIRLSGQEGQRYKSHGWHVGERFGSWAAAKRVGLHLVLRPKPQKKMTVAASIRLFGKAGQVRVFANGERIAVWDIPEGPEVLRFASIPKELVLEDGDLELTFESPHVLPVRALNPKSGDARSLGLGLSAAQVVEEGSEELWNGITVLPPLPVDQPVPLSESESLISAQGFHPREPSGKWSKYKESELTFRINTSGPAVLRLEVWAPLAKSARARILVKCGESSREVRLHGGGNEIVRIPVEAPASGFCSAVFLVDSMFIPSLHRDSEDSRKLGVLVRSLTVLNATEDEVPTTPETSSAGGRRFPQMVRRHSRRLARALRAFG